MHSQSPQKVNNVHALRQVILYVLDNAHVVSVLFGFAATAEKGEQNYSPIEMGWNRDGMS